MIKKIIYLTIILLVSANADAQAPKKIRKFGYIDKQDNWVIQPVFDNAYPFVDSVAVVRINEKWGLIDKKGSLILDTIYDYINPTPYNGIYIAQKEKEYTDTWFGIRKNGEVLFEKSCDYIWSFEEGLARFEYRYYGFIDTSGNEVIDDVYYDATDFSEGLAKVNNYGWGYVNKTGKLKIKHRYKSATEFRSGFAAVIKDSLVNIINPKGKVISTINCNYLYLDNFSEGKIALKEIESQVVYYFSPEGVKLFDNGYHYGGEFKNGIARVIDFSNNTYFINSKGERVSDYFNGGGDFIEGQAVVRTSNGWGIIDSTFNLITKDTYNICSKFSEGLAAAAVYIE